MATVGAGLGGGVMRVAAGCMGWFWGEAGGPWAVGLGLGWFMVECRVVNY